MKVPAKTTHCHRLAGIRRLVAAFLLSVTGLAAADRPNIIFILCDDLGYGDVGVFYQNQRAALRDPKVPAFATPQLDLLAAKGMILTQHYCGAPVCAPSRASLLTGLTQGNANVRDNQFDKALADTHTLGSVLRTAGYATAAIGKWGLQGGGESPEANGGKKSAAKPGGKKKARNSQAASAGGAVADWPAYPTKRGFDFYYGFVRHKDGHFHYPKEDKREVWENEREVSADLDLCYTADLFTARAKKWISEQVAAQPKQRPQVALHRCGASRASFLRCTALSNHHCQP
jgi:arylsulfatase A-like enzyme